MYVVLKVQNRNGSQLGYRFFILYNIKKVLQLPYKNDTLKGKPGLT